MNWYEHMNWTKLYISCVYIIPVEPHEAVPEVSKGKVHITQNKHVPIEWLVTTASQSRIWLKLLSDDSNKVCLLCRSTQLHATTSCRSQFATTCGSSYVLQTSTPYWKSTTLYYKVLIQYYSSTTLYMVSATPVLLCTTKYYSSTTKYYSSTTLYYKVLIQYYSVLQSTTPVLLSTTKYYSVLHSTTLYYTVLLKYYSVLQSTTPVLLCTTPVLLCTTKYYSVLQSTTSVLLCTTKYYSVLQRTTPVLFCTTKYYSSTTLYYKVLLQYYSHDWSASPMKLYLQCAEKQRCFYKITDCCACHGKWLSWLIRITYETLVTMRGATEMSLQHHQLLRLPRKVTLIIDPLHTWNVIYNARSNMCHSPNSPNTAPATKSNTHHWYSSHMKR